MFDNYQGSKKKAIIGVILIAAISGAIFIPLILWVDSTFNEDEKWLIHLGVFVSAVIVGIVATFLQRRNGNKNE